MWVPASLLALLLACGSHAWILSPKADKDADRDKYRLPKEFLFGAGTSAYQTEGAWDAEGKGVDVFDFYYHNANKPTNRTGDIAALSYYRFKEDIALAKQLGFDVLRFSINWARIFPRGTNDTVNEEGVQHYHEVIDEVLKYGIVPLVTIHHFDYPQELENQFGGWLSEKMQPVFRDYADFLFNEYGDKVKYWLTINEAAMYCRLTGAMRMVPPMKIKTNEQAEMCLHNLILGHAMAYRVYEEKYKERQKGMVGFGVGPQFSGAASDSAEDREAADNANMRNGIGLSLYPLVHGDYPDIAKSASRPNFTEEQKATLLKTQCVDFAGVNIYSARKVSASGGSGVGFLPGDDGRGDGPPGPPGGGGSGGGGFGPPGGTGDAWSLRDMPKWINEKFKDLPVFITENGGSSGSGLDDWEERAVYVSAWLRELIVGINEDKNKVIGYTLWSFIDTFEFDGYGRGAGMVHVDFTSGSFKRTLKTSKTFFKKLTTTRMVPLAESGSKPFPDEPNSSAEVSGSVVLTIVTFIAANVLK